jgi:quercetin dioxygenase-like cupin family protein
MSEVKRYTKVVRSGDGGSAFEDAEIPLRQQQVADAVPPMFAGGLRSAAGVVFLRSAEFDSDPHPAPASQWVVMLRGAIEIEVSDGTRRRFEPGDLLLVTDTTGTGHLTSAVGDPPLEALFVPEIPAAG